MVADSGQVLVAACGQIGMAADMCSRVTAICPLAATRLRRAVISRSDGVDGGGDPQPGDLGLCRRVDYVVARWR